MRHEANNKHERSENREGKSVIFIVVIFCEKAASCNRKPHEGVDTKVFILILLRYTPPNTKLPIPTSNFSTETTGELNGTCKFLSIIFALAKSNKGIMVFGSIEMFMFS